MGEARKYYCLCEDNCKFETLSKEQVFAAIADATGKTPTDVDKAFITKIKDRNTGKNISFWVGTEAEYNALSPAPESKPFVVRLDENGNVYVCEDDKTLPNLQKHMTNKENPHGVTVEQIGAAPAVESKDYPGCYYRIVDGVVEWINPPLVIGVAYRTTDRYNGKPVYVKAVELSLSASGEKVVGIDYSITHVVSIEGTVKTADLVSLPIAGYGDGFKVLGNGNLYSSITIDGGIAYPIVKYTK